MIYINRIFLTNIVFNFIFLINKYYFNDNVIEPEYTLYNNLINSYGFKKKLINLLEQRLETTANVLVKDLLDHEWEVFMLILDDIVPYYESVIYKKLLNICMLDIILAYRGWCHFRGTPVRGQRTWSNAWSAYKSNWLLRNFRLNLARKQYGANIPEREANVAHIAEQVNLMWKFQWEHEWILARNSLLGYKGHPKTMKIDLYSMYNYQVMHPLKLKNMSKKQQQSFKKNYFSLGFEPGFTKPLLNQRYNIEQEVDPAQASLLGASLITRDERLNRKNPQKKAPKKASSVKQEKKKKSVWD